MNQIICLPQNEDKEDLLKWLNRMNLEDEPKSFEEEQTQDQQNAVTRIENFFLENVVNMFLNRLFF